MHDPLCAIQQGIRTFTLDLANLGHGTIYDDLLAEIRQYSVQRAPFMCRNTPTTPANGYFIIRLVEDALSVRLLIRECDGYLVAIQRGDGFWFHFDGETPPDFIAESSVQMRMEASYVSLAPNGRYVTRDI